MYDAVNEWLQRALVNPRFIMGAMVVQALGLITIIVALVNGNSVFVF